MKPWYLSDNGHEKAAAMLRRGMARYPIDPDAFCGTPEGCNPLTLAVDPALKGYRIFVSPYDADADRQEIRLTARDDVTLLYAAADFCNYYLPFARDAVEHCPTYYLLPLFTAPMKPCDYLSACRVRKRGIWTWGHVICDYKRLIQNMAELKLNLLTVWDDYPPANIRDVIDYAHDYGIAVYLGYPWGWDVQCSTADLSDLNAMSDGIVEVYNRQYRGIGFDGIYFQSFTELKEDRIGGMLVAEKVVELVNRTAGILLAQEPALQLQFGLHADSVKTHLDIIAGTDRRVEIVWEDVGAFPYQYMPQNTAGFNETLALHQTLRTLRPGGGFGAVFKGVICLDWSTFRHQTGPITIPTSETAPVIPAFKREILRIMQAYWMKNCGCAQRMLQACGPEDSISCLVEDGYLESAVNFPTALYAQMLWDGTAETGDILAAVAQRPDVTFF